MSKKPKTQRKWVGGAMSKLFNRKKGALKNGDANENNYQREISQIKLF